MNGKRPAFFLFLLLFIGLSLSAQSISIEYFDSDNYQRPDLFLEQDRIYGKEVGFSQGLELICLQDKVKAEIQGLGTFYTPLDLNNIPSGDYTVQLSKTGYNSLEFRVTVSSEKRSSVIVDLKPLTGTLSLSGLPEGALVYINNSPIEGHSSDVPIGEASLRIIAFGYDEFVQIINIEESEEQIFTPELVKKAFSLSELSLERESIWLFDTVSQRQNVVILKATAPGHGILRIERDEILLEEQSFQISEKETHFSIDTSDQKYNNPGQYIVSVEVGDGDNEESRIVRFTIKEGGKARWRNVFTGAGGFQFCPDPLVLPTSVSQLQTGFSLVSQLETIENLYIPAYLSFRTSFLKELELAVGTAMYLSPEVSESAIDLFASAKYGLYGGDSSHGFNASVLLSINYNGQSDAFELISPFDPFGGVSGLALSLPISYGFSEFSIIFSPELRVSPSYPLEENGGFQSGDIHVWNYFRGAIAWDHQWVSLAVSAAVQSPSYTEWSEKWPLYCGLDATFSPGSSGFTFGFYSGVRYSKEEEIQFSAGTTAGFMF